MRLKESDPLFELRLGWIMSAEWDMTLTIREVFFLPHLHPRGSPPFFHNNTDMSKTLHSRKFCGFCFCDGDSFWKIMRAEWNTTLLIHEVLHTTHSHTHTHIHKYIFSFWGRWSARFLLFLLFLHFWSTLFGGWVLSDIWPKHPHISIYLSIYIYIGVCM